MSVFSYNLEANVKMELYYIYKCPNSEFIPHMWHKNYGYLTREQGKRHTFTFSLNLDHVDVGINWFQNTAYMHFTFVNTNYEEYVYAAMKQ